MNTHANTINIKLDMLLLGIFIIDVESIDNA